MFVLRRTLCDGLSRGIRFHTGSVSAWSRVSSRDQGGFTVARGLETSTCLTHVRGYAQVRKEAIPSQLDDLPPSMLQKDYAGVPLTEGVNDIVKRLLSLEMASQSEKLKVKTQQLVEKVTRNPDDNTSPEVRIAVMTARIRNLQEHLRQHPKDKANKRRMMMTTDKRKKMLKNLRLTRFDAFENVCQQLGIEYTFPPLYYRRATHRWLAKKALCLKVYQEKKRLQAAGLWRKRSAQTRTEEKTETPV
uniref:Small ribosomal subunit protein uS15m n=1 Tax=Leptobrachium leishanense TaxID=445787 RepID=A0A8C5LM77_9ANUR